MTTAQPTDACWPSALSGPRRWHGASGRTLVAVLLLAPALLYLLAMAVYPTIYSLWLSSTTT